MTCGKLHVQAYNFVWILSTVYLVCNAQPKLAGVKSTTQAIFNLVIQRPRVAGGSLIIPLGTTVKAVNAFSKDTKHHIVRLHYGSKGKNLAMRASSSQECEQWYFALTAALSASQQSVKYSPSTGSSPSCSTNTHTTKYPKKPEPNRSMKLSQTRTSIPTVSNSVSSIKTQDDVNFFLASPFMMTSSGSPSTESTTIFPEVPSTTRSAPANCSFRRMVRQNIPSSMQFLIAVSQIMASAS